MAPTAPLSFAAALEKKQEDKTLRVVQLDGSVVLKIVKHCQESQPALVTGQLLGLDIGSTLEVTDCFPFPVRITVVHSNNFNHEVEDLIKNPSRQGEEEEVADDGASYQLDMMRCLREVNVDNNTVGWYQSTIMGSYQTLELIDTFVNYQESIKRCICIIYDPQRTVAGGLKAVKLQDSFIELYKAGGITMEKLKAANVTWHDVFEDIPIRIQSSALVSALMAHITPDTAGTQSDYSNLRLGAGPLLEKNLDFMNECLDDVVQEQQKVSFYHRNVARQQAQQAQWLQKRRQENAQRRAAGEEPLPDEDPALFKPIVEPSPLDCYLLNSQISNYCDQLHNFSSSALQKLNLLNGLQKVHFAN